MFIIGSLLNGCRPASPPCTLDIPTSHLAQPSWERSGKTYQALLAQPSGV